MFRSRWWRVAGGVAVVVVAVVVVTPRLGAQSSKVGPGTVAVSFRPAPVGQTTLALPPLGQVSARTHRSPVDLHLELRSLDVSSLVDRQGTADTGALADRIRDDLPAAIRATVVRTLVIAAIVGAVAAAVLPGRRRRSVIGGALVGVLVMGVLMASVVPGFDSGQFDEVTFQGSLSSGSKLLGTVTGGPNSPIGRRLGSLSDKLAGLYSSTVSDDVDESAGETVILHISDLHLNPLGAELARRLATSFDVDAVLDTGDTTSFGTPFEGRFAELVSGFPVPYLYVGGNHDSLANRAAIAAAPGVEAIDRRVAKVGDVRILGFDDPVVTTAEHVDRAERERVEADAAPDLEALARRSKPDLVAVHNPVILDGVGRIAPVAVAGHLHRFELAGRDGMIIAVVGSTGATGLGSLLTESDEPYSAELLRFRGRDLVAIDQLEVVGTEGDLVVRRHTVTAHDRSAGDAGFTGSDVDEGNAVATTTSTSSSVPVSISASSTTAAPAPRTTER